MYRWHFEAKCTAPLCAVVGIDCACSMLIVHLPLCVMSRADVSSLTSAVLAIRKYNVPYLDVSSGDVPGVCGKETGQGEARQGLLRKFAQQIPRFFEAFQLYGIQRIEHLAT